MRVELEGEEGEEKKNIPMFTHNKHSTQLSGLPRGDAYYASVMWAAGGSNSDSSCSLHEMMQTGLIQLEDHI